MTVLSRSYNLLLHNYAYLLRKNSKDKNKGAFLHIIYHNYSAITPISTHIRLYLRIFCL